MRMNEDERASNLFLASGAVVVTTYMNCLHKKNDSKSGDSIPNC